MKIICPICEKTVFGYVPRGGDGSALRPRRHGECEGRFELVDASEAIETRPTSHAPDASPLAGDQSEALPGEAPVM